MLFFRSEDHASAWREQRGLRTAQTISLAQAGALAQAWYGRKLAPDWRRHALEETEALFAEIGMQGDFWRLRP